MNLDGPKVSSEEDTSDGRVGYERVVLSIGIATGVSFGLWILAGAAVYANEVIPFWVPSLAAVAGSIVLWLYDVVTPE